MRREKIRGIKKITALIILLLLSICGCSKTVGQTKKQKKEPVIKVGVSGIAASDSALLRVN